MSLLVVDRFHSSWRRQRQARADAQHLHAIETLALLEGETLRPLALLSLWLFVGSALVFAGLDLVAYYWHYQAWLAPLSFWGILVWIICNALGYCIILPIHELIHGLCILFWGGRPHFGARLPLVLYCGARAQLFRRAHYLVVALAPLCVLTLLGIVVTLLSPGFAAYLLLAFVGNFSGAAGDLLVAWRVARLPAGSLIEDTETGYTAWDIDAV